MNKTITYWILALLLGGGLFQACSNNTEAESEPEKGAIEKMTDRTAKQIVNRIRTPINKARSVKDQQEGRQKDIEESLKD